MFGRAARLFVGGVPERLSSYSTLSNSYEVVIGGGGIMGCSSAFFLAQRMRPSSICIVEKDPKYEQASTPLSVGSIRQQFSIPANIQLSMYSSDFIQNIASYLYVEGSDEPPDVQFVKGSYVFLATAGGEESLRENQRTQTEQGASVELMNPQQLKEIYPWINTEGVKLASRGVRNEGWFDPWLLLSAFKKKVLSMGVQYVTGELSDVTVNNDRVTGVKVTAKNGNHEEIECEHLVNTGGPWAARLALMAGVGDSTQSNRVMHTALPVKPRRRCVFVFKCPDLNIQDFPMLVNTDGVYVRKEGGTFICGVSPQDHLDHDDVDLEVDYPLFDEYIWPSLAQRVPAFECLKLQSAWAGYYDYNTLDQNAIIGRHPVINNLLFANGFSGHGIQQAPAVGRAVSEILLDSSSHSIDISRFSFERIIKNLPYKEKNIV